MSYSNYQLNTLFQNLLSRVNALSPAFGFVPINGNTTINDIKTFTQSPLGPTPSINDNSNKLATTNYVVSQINKTYIAQSCSIYYNVSGKGLYTPSPTISFINYSSLNMNDSVLFNLNICIRGPDFSNHYSGYIEVYPKAFANSNNNLFFLTNGIGDPNTNIKYSPLPLGVLNRPFWCFKFLNEANIASVLGLTTSSTPDGKSNLIFNFPSLGLDPLSTYNVSIDLNLVSLGKMNRTDISSVSFNTNF